jgi:putative DNA methylase
MTKAKKLIEVAMPIKEISAESVRDKSIRHGHISTLHLWWARRPLPVCRAVVFASLVPDPEDENCPQAFKDAVELLLGRQENNTDPYKPYNDIPYTSAIDKMEDTLRNRLMMFIGKFSEKYIQAAKQGKSAAAKDMLSDASLIKWDNKNDDTIIGKARKLIWVSHNCSSGKTAKELLKDFETAYKAIKDAEAALYSLPDRHIENEKSKQLTDHLQNAIDTFQDKMPKVFDPFAGGGAIPLEAARLGCKTYGNDINPVAHIIQKGSLEFPQKYGKPITYSNAEFVKLYGEETLKTIPNEWKTFSGGNAIGVQIPNRLSFDVEYYSKKLLTEAEKHAGYLYPSKKDETDPIAYYWARTAFCSNPTCRAEVPLLKQFYICNKRDKKIFLNPVITNNNISFELKQGDCKVEGWVHSRKNLRCPVCGNNTSNQQLKEQFLRGKTNDRLLAVIEKSKTGKIYRLPNKEELNILTVGIDKSLIPSESLPVEYTKAFDLCTWGFSKHGDLYSKRQLLAMHQIVMSLELVKNDLKSFGDEYEKGLSTYLAILINRIASRMTTFGIYNLTAETFEHPFGRQAIAMVFDYPEVNPFSNYGGGGYSQIDWIKRYIESECDSPFYSKCNNSSSGDKSQFGSKFLTAVITDPPYYDAIGYADLSDFFYVWLKRSLIHEFPYNFATPQTPKSDECTALKHYHNGEISSAKHHFEVKLLQIFDAIEKQTEGVVSIMYAHQSTEAWTTLCNSILGASMNITGSWAIDTERTSGTKVNKAFLSSSVTVSARPSQRQGYGEYREVKKAIEKTVIKEVEELYRLGFRGADLLTACFGQAVSEFGKYEKVEKADGGEVTVAELLEMARESAFNALLKGFVGDDFTKFYIAWLQLYGFIESDFDDAAKFSRVGLSINVQELFTDHILIKNGNKQALGGYNERIAASKNLGDKADSHLIDQVHRAMHLYQGSNRGNLLEFIHRVAANPDSSFWRVLTSLCEILPGGSDDHKQATGLIANKESLIRESATAQKQKASQSNLFE